MDGEIIETYWNVNYAHVNTDLQGTAEIIETYWNVNITAVAITAVAITGNNRNILECKSETLEDVDKKADGNNRNILECK